MNGQHAYEPRQCNQFAHRNGCEAIAWARIFWPCVGLHVPHLQQTHSLESVVIWMLKCDLNFLALCTIDYMYLSNNISMTLNIWNSILLQYFSIYDAYFFCKKQIYKKTRMKWFANQSFGGFKKMNLLFILWTFEPKCKNSGVLNSRTCNQIHHNHQGNLLPFWNYLEFLDNFQIFFHWTFVQNNRSDHTKTTIEKEIKRQILHVLISKL